MLWEEAERQPSAMRRGKPLMLRISAAAMHAAGHVFYRSANGVWLTEPVPPRFIEFSA